VVSPTFVLLKPQHFKAHDLHLNSRGKKKITFLTANSLGDKNVSDASSIPVITSAAASSF
jgi:hypothetical protein